MPLKFNLTAADISERAEDMDTVTLLCMSATSKLHMYSAEERARRELAALAEFDDEIQVHEAYVEEVGRDVQAELDLIEDIDPRGLDEMGEEDIALMVRTWLPIAQHDVLTMPAADLERCCRTVIALGDRRRMSAYAVAIRGRLDSFTKQYADTPIREIPAEVTRERSQLSVIAGPLEAALVDPKREQRKQAAFAQQERVRELRKRISDARDRAHRVRERDAAMARQRNGTL